MFTNKRIFHVPTTANYGYRNSIAQILCTDCSSIKIRGSVLVVQYKNGKKEKFLYIASRERKKIKALLSTLSFEGAPSKTQQRTHLCPRCTKELEQRKYTCSNCRLEFKSREEAKRLSLIYPGGGYFYTGHPFLGVSDALTEAILLFLVLAGLASMIQGAKGGTAALVVFGIALAIEKAITVYHSNHFIKEYITKEKDIKSVAYKEKEQQGQANSAFEESRCHAKTPKSSRARAKSLILMFAFFILIYCKRHSTEKHK